LLKMAITLMTSRGVEGSLGSLAVRVVGVRVAE
jgi:hypothetical protein